MTPLQQEHLVHLALWVSFPKAVKLLSKLMGVHVSEATARRHTEAAGAAYEALQNEQASQLLHEQEKKSQKRRARSCPGVVKEPASKVLRSHDGAMVPLVGGVWAEAKTVVIGEVKSKEKRCKQRPEQHVETINLSYFSRLSDAETFGRLATVATEGRGVGQAKEVCAVQDGAEWIQGVVDLHRADALRILAFAHAAGYLREIAELVRAAGTPLPEQWLTQQLHELKHQGPTAVLQEVRRLLQLHPHVPDLEQKVSYLCKREPYMQYPRYQELGWPIGSGSVGEWGKCQQGGGSSPARMGLACAGNVRMSIRCWLCAPPSVPINGKQLGKRPASSVCFYGRSAASSVSRRGRRPLCPSCPASCCAFCCWELLLAPRLLILGPNLLPAPRLPRLSADRLLTIPGAVASLQKHDAHSNNDIGLDLHV